MKDIKAICYPPGDNWRFYAAGDGHIPGAGEENIDRRIWLMFEDKWHNISGGACAREIMRDLKERTGK